MKQNEQNTPGRVRKEYAPTGTTSQKMMSFRIDLENLSWLQLKGNKGRYINELIKADREKQAQG